MKLPIVFHQKDGKYPVYVTNKLCDAKIGTKLNKTLESNPECCAIREKARHSYADSCKILPEPKLIHEPTEAYLKCYDNEAGWSIVEGK